MLLSGTCVKRLLSILSLPARIIISIDYFSPNSEEMSFFNEDQGFRGLPASVTPPEGDQIDVPDNVDLEEQRSRQ